MGTTANFAFRYPDSTNSVNVPQDIQNAAVDIDAWLKARFPAPVSYNDGAATDGTTTVVSPTYTNTLTTTGIAGVVFTASNTGKAVVEFTVGQARSSVASGIVVLGVEVRSGTTIGSGTAVYAANSVPSETVVCVSVAAGDNHSASGAAVVSGLTAGSQYNACIVYTTFGGTATVNRRNIRVTA